MRKDTTKKFLMRENRYLERMISFEMNKFLSRKKKRIACDMIDFTNVLGTKSTCLNMKNILESGDKTRERVSKNRKIVEFNMVYCESGSFTMGHSAFKSNQPRPETIERAFWLGETEVTQELYELVMGKNPSEFKDKSKYPNAPKHPVEQMDLEDTIKFCNALSSLQGLQECYTKNSNPKDEDQAWDNFAREWLCDFSKNGYRLPTEKEWEYAAKAGTQNRWAGTDNKDELTRYAWFGEDVSKGSTHPVKMKKPNEWGFYDMTGNLTERCWDKFCSSRAEAEAQDDEDDAIKDFVGRGGSWGTDSENNAIWLYVTQRYTVSPYHAYYAIGFRICRTF